MRTRRDAGRGLYEKFIVKRTDGRHRKGEKHEGCSYFVLDLIHDEHAVAALRAYADSCEEDFRSLARDLRVHADHLAKLTKKPPPDTFLAGYPWTCALCKADIEANEAHRCPFAGEAVIYRDRAR